MNMTPEQIYLKQLSVMSERSAVLAGALRELLELVESDATFENRDIDPYKYDAIVDDVKRRAVKALKFARGEQ